MKKLSKKLVLAGMLSAAMAISSAVPAFAAESWQQNQTGWWYQSNDGSYVTTSWKMINGAWYYFNADGYMSTGWINENGRWYFADSTGAMQSGWVAVDNGYYYLNPVSDGTKGAMKTGDAVIDGTTYHFGENGACTNAQPNPGMKRFTKTGIKIERSGSGSGSGSSNSSNVSNEIKEMNEKVAKKVNDTVEAAKKSGEIGKDKAVTDVTITGDTNTDKKTVTVTLNEDLKETKTIADVEAIFTEPVKTMIEDENVKVITYGELQFTDKTLAQDHLDKLIEDQGGRSLNTLKSSYTVKVELATGGTVTYTFSIPQ